MKFEPSLNQVRLNCNGVLRCFMGSFWEVCEVLGSFKDRDYVQFLCNFLKGGEGRSPLSLNRLWPVSLALGKIFLFFYLLNGNVLGEIFLGFSSVLRLF